MADSAGWNIASGLAGAVPVVGGVLSSVIGAIGAASANNRRNQQQQAMMDAIKGRPDYQISDASKDYLGATYGQQNAINPAIMQEYQQAQVAQATQNAAAERAASSGAEALSADAASASRTQSMFPELQAQQTAYAQQNQGNYYNALQNMQHEQQMVSQDRLAKNSDLVNLHLGMAGAANQNFGQSLGLLTSGIQGITAGAGNIAGMFKNGGAPTVGAAPTVVPTSGLGTSGVLGLMPLLKTTGQSGGITNPNYPQSYAGGNPYIYGGW